MWTAARLTIYITTALGGLGVILAGLGWATFDTATGTLDLGPVHIYALAPLIAGPLASLIAALAVLFKWGPSK